MVVATGSLCAACSLTAIDPQPCDDDGDCRHAFGVGSVCQDDGYCSTRQIHPRCNQSWPPELLVAPDTYGDAIVIGSLFSFVDHLDTRNAAELAIRELELQQGLVHILPGLERFQADFGHPRGKSRQRRQGIRRRSTPPTVGERKSYNIGSGHSFVAAPSGRYRVPPLNQILKGDNERGRRLIV